MKDICTCFDEQLCFSNQLKPLSILYSRKYVDTFYMWLADVCIKDCS